MIAFTLLGAAAQLAAAAPRSPLDTIATLPHAVARTENGALVIELPPTHLPASHNGEESHVLTPVCQVIIPVNASLHSFRVEIVDRAGNQLPQTFLHHVNLTDPSRRELFLETSLHIVAASKETPLIDVPAVMFGMPVREGYRFIVSGMLANETHEDYHDVRIRLIFEYVHALWPWPVYDVYPWVMDVMFPLGQQPGGSKAFDLPPGKSERSWEARPAVRGTLLGLGGHMHDYGVSLELMNATTGELLWRDQPIADSAGQVLKFPVTRFYRWHDLGVEIDPSHTYRVTVRYDNPTGELIPDGGMGAVAGLFVPERGAVWPSVDATHPVYRQDLWDALRNGIVVMRTGHHH